MIPVELVRAYLKHQQVSQQAVRILYSFKDATREPEWKTFKQYEFDDNFLYHLLSGLRLPYKISNIVDFGDDQKIQTQGESFGVNVIEIDDDPMYVYVGESKQAPEERLKVHLKRGLYAAQVFRSGATGRLRPALYVGIPRFSSRLESESAEWNLAQCLWDEGYTLKGDAKRILD